MGRHWLKAIGIAVILTAGIGCGAEDSEVSSQVGEATESTLDYQLWDQPVDIALNENIAGETDFGECEWAEPDDPNVDVQINCQPAWLEVAWYRLPSAELLEPMSIGARTLEVSFEADRILRASIHAVEEDGSRTKLVSQKTLYSGNALQVELEEARDHYIFVGRGQTLLPVWGTGSVNFSFTASAY